MKAIVDQDLCISCGACIDICSEVFDWNDDGKADAKQHEIPSDLEDSVREASEACPTDAIPLED